MTIDEMINFNISECMTLIAKEADLKIVDGVYTISQMNELEFNKEEIKKMLLMFKPMQKELATYKKALELACEDIRCANPEAKNCDKCPLSFNSNCFSTDNKIDYYLKKARESYEQKAQEDL